MVTNNAESSKFEALAMCYYSTRTKKRIEKARQVLSSYPENAIRLLNHIKPLRDDGIHD